MKKINKSSILGNNYQLYYDDINDIDLSENRHNGSQVFVKSGDNYKIYQVSRQDNRKPNFTLIDTGVTTI